MVAGRDRSDARYAWPKTLIQPVGVRVVYLDLNHWISLAKAATGHRDGAPHREALECVRSMRASGRFAFPISSAHIMELAGIRSARQRFDIAQVMEELSGFRTLVDHLIVMRLEVEAAVDAASGASREARYATVPLLGNGCLQAVGRRGGLRVFRHASDGTKVDVTEAQRLGWPGGKEVFDKWQAEAELALDRAILRGPADTELPQLRALGWDPSVAGRGADQRALQEQQQAERLAADPRWRKGRLRDLIATRYIALEVREMLEDALNARGLDLEAVWGDVASARSFSDSMPSADVWISLLTERHKKPDTRWVRNHIFDLDGLSVAVPYCDIVVPDKESRHLLLASGAAARLGTSVPASLSEFVEHAAEIRD